MSFRKSADKLVFADDKTEKAFNSLGKNDVLKKSILRSIERIKDNVFCGENIPKKQIPREYVKKYGIDNLWWYPLPNAWRLVYSVMGTNSVAILAVIIDYFDHKNYERKFRY